MRILIIADMDDLHWHHGPGEADLILALGDTADSLILEAAEANNAPPIFGVKGNHCSPAPFPEGITDLHLRTAEFGGLTFGGFNGSWKYKPRGHFLYEQDEVMSMLKQLPAVDVLISHNSPRGIHDKPDDVHTGFDALNWYIEQHKPKLMFHGHQHINRETAIGTTKVIGVYGHQFLELSAPQRRILQETPDP
jgi:Icc-related predicted phosphoesterase